jgi:hypothetical protein
LINASLQFSDPYLVSEAICRLSPLGFSQLGFTPRELFGGILCIPQGIIQFLAQAANDD